MKKAVVVFAHARPKILARCLGALSKCDDLDSYDVWIFQDAARDEVEKADVEAAADLIASCDFIHTHVVEEMNLGLGLNLIYARERLFSEQEYDVVVQVEDDIIVAPYALRALEALAESNAAVGALEDQPIVGLRFFDALNRNEAQKISALREVEQHCPLVCARLTKFHWAAMRDVVLDYAKKFLEPLRRRGRPYKWRDDDGIRAYLSAAVGVGLPSTWATGQDGAMVVDALAARIPMFAPTVNHVLHVGLRGEHVTPGSDVARTSAEARLLPGSIGDIVVEALGSAYALPWSVTSEVGRVPTYTVYTDGHYRPVGMPLMQNVLQYGTSSVTMRLVSTCAQLTVVEPRAGVAQRTVIWAARDRTDSGGEVRVKAAGAIALGREDDAMAAAKIPTEPKFDTVVLSPRAGRACLESAVRRLEPGGHIVLENATPAAQRFLSERGHVRTWRSEDGREIVARSPER